MAEAFLTTRQGAIDSLTLYRYDISDSIIADSLKMEKFKFRLQNRLDILIYDIESTCFFTLAKLPDDQTSQYKIHGSKQIFAPFKNTQLISNIISKLLKIELSKHYKQFFNQNIFYVTTVDLSPFHLLKAFEFNVEVFPTGHYLIHILPVSKIVSSKAPVDKNYINNLKIANANNSKEDVMEFNLINIEKFYRKKINLLHQQLTKHIDETIMGSTNFIATFDYHFLANYSPELFQKVTEHTTKNLNQTIKFLDPILDNFKLPEFFNLSPEKYLKANILSPIIKNNLLVGRQAETITLHSKTTTQYGVRLEYTRDDIAPDELIATFPKNKELLRLLNECNLPITLKAKVEQKEGWKHLHITQIFLNSKDRYTKSSIQSSSYFNGIYRPASNCNILPIVYDDLNIAVFNQLVGSFNQGASNFKILPPIFLCKDNIIQRAKIQEVISAESNKTMIAVFCRYKLPNEYFAPVKSFKFQIYQGDTSDNAQNRPKLSNFVCKCLEKLGGVVTAISDTHVSKESYFIGIDLGHTTVGDEKFSNLAMTIFDKRGLLISTHIEKELPRKENLIEDDCIRSFQQLSTTLSNKGLSKPKQLIIHRDGKLHSNDIIALTNSIQAVWRNIKIDIVEIIKSGFPVIVMKDENGRAINLESGSSYQNDQHKYSILVTNTQADDHSTIIRPLIIKHKYGDTDFHKIVDQVYWFTKVYTSNLYNSTRLPATTLKANNIVSTSTKQHKATYLG